jgi:ADP-ribosylglycohydrolase
MALGDTYGMKYEFVEHEQNKGIEDLYYAPHPTFTDYKQGYYTDDTQMSLANAELLLSGKTISVDSLILQWLNVFKRDPRVGYSKHMFGILNESLSPEAFLSNINPNIGVTGGAAMRAAPFGLSSDINEVKTMTVEQAMITHNTAVGLLSSEIVALSVHFLHHGGKRAVLSLFLTEQLGSYWNQYSTTAIDNGLYIVYSGIDLLCKAKALSDILLGAVNQHPLSDTDTVCAIAMVMASRATDIVDDIPAVMHEELEAGSYGGSYLKKLDKDLLIAFPSTKMYEAY